VPLVAASEALIAGRVPLVAASAAVIGGLVPTRRSDEGR